MSDIFEVIAKLKDALWHQYGNVLQKQYSQHEIHYTQQSVSAAFIAGLRVGEKNAKEMADIIVKDRLADAIAALKGE